MIGPEAPLPALYVRHIAEQVRSMGAPVEPWLRMGGLSEGDLSNPSLVVPYEAFRALALGAMVHTGEPAMGLLVGERLVASTHGILGYGVMNSGTLRQAIELFERFSGLRTALLSISHEAAGDEARVRFTEARPLGELWRPVIEAVVVSIKNVLGGLSPLHARRVAFSFDDPGYGALARDLLGCEVRYGQPWSGLAFAADQLDRPLKMSDPEAFREAAELCQRELAKITSATSMAASVRRLFLSKQGGFPSLQVTARIFHMTPRTLHRRLLDEGTSYQQLLDEVRYTLAAEHMRSGRLSIEEIACTLGYSDLANFRRAFKRWSSVTPSAFRARQRGRKG